METKNVNLRDVQLLHEGIIQAMDALRRISPAMTEVATVQAFGTPMPFDPFGVGRASFEHAAFNSRLGWGNPVLGSLPFGFGVSPFGFGDVYSRGLSHSPFNNVVTNPILGTVPTFGTIGGFSTGMGMTGISPFNTLGYGTMSTLGNIPFVPFRTF